MEEVTAVAALYNLFEPDKINYELKILTPAEYAVLIRQIQERIRVRNSNLLTMV